MTVTRDAFTAVPVSCVTGALRITVDSKVAWVTFAAGPRARLPFDADAMLARAGLGAVTGPVPRVTGAGVGKGASSVSGVTAIAAME